MTAEEMEELHQAEFFRALEYAVVNECPDHLRFAREMAFEVVRKMERP